MITFDRHIIKDAIGLVKIVIKVTMVTMVIKVIRVIKVNGNFIIIVVEFDIVENFMPVMAVAEMIMLIIRAVRMDSGVNYLFGYLL